MTLNEIEVGDRVAAGEGQDYDEGKIISIDSPEQVTVSWDSGVRTPAFLNDLNYLCPNCGLVECVC